jgi:hypothetical protein
MAVREGFRSTSGGLRDWAGNEGGVPAEAETDA